MMLVAPMLTLLLWTACTAAEDLDISRRGLETAPADLCSRGVRAANLCGNRLRSAPPCCDTFRRLYLYRNNIHQLPDHWLDGCPLLEELSVSGNSLRQLPAQLLGSSSALRRLQASRNLLDTLPAQLLNNATSLTELDFSHNSLMELPRGFLDRTSLLVELFLQANSLSALPEELLASCGGLQVLWLSRNQLARLPKPLLSSAPLLRTLRLDHNIIADIAGGAFDNNYQLHFLDLSSNRLTSLPAGLFRKATSLRRLLLADNLLSVVPPAGSLPTQPAVIDLSHNLLQTIEDFSAFGESRVTLDHNAWCHDLIPASQLSNFDGPEKLRWFQQRPVRYDRLAGRVKLSAAGLLHCGASTAARRGRVTSAADARMDSSVTDPATTAYINYGADTESPSPSETIVPLTNDFVDLRDLKTDEGGFTLDSKYTTPLSAMPEKNTASNKDVEVTGVDGNETTARYVGSDIAATMKPETNAPGHFVFDVSNTTNELKTSTSITETDTGATYQP